MDTMHTLYILCVDNVISFIIGVSYKFNKNVFSIERFLKWNYYVANKEEIRCETIVAKFDNIGKTCQRKNKLIEIKEEKHLLNTHNATLKMTDNCRYVSGFFNLSAAPRTSVKRRCPAGPMEWAALNHERSLRLF